MKLVGPKISFSNAECPICKKWLSFPHNNELQVVAEEYAMLYEDIKKKTQQRMKFEESEKNKRFQNPENTLLQ